MFNDITFNIFEISIIFPNTQNIFIYLNMIVLKMIFAKFMTPFADKFGFGNINFVFNVLII